MFCHKCSRELPDNSLFCSYCGTKIKPEDNVIQNRLISYPKFITNKLFKPILIISAFLVIAVLISFNLFSTPKDKINIPNNLQFKPEIKAIINDTTFEKLLIDNLKYCAAAYNSKDKDNGMLLSSKDFTLNLTLIFNYRKKYKPDDTEMAITMLNILSPSYRITNLVLDSNMKVDFSKGLENTISYPDEKSIAELKASILHVLDTYFIKE